MASTLRRALGPVKLRLINHITVVKLWLEGNKDQANIEEAKNILGKLFKYTEKFNSIIKDLNIASQGTPENLERFENELEEYMELELNSDELAIELTNLIDTRERNDISLKTLNKTPAKLPKITLPTFSGDRMKWNEFWETFQSIIDNNNSLNPIDKFNYLKGLLSGEAMECIRGIPLSESNYKLALSLLENRYGNQNLILETIYEKFRNLPKSSNTVSRLRYTINEIETYCRSLLGLKENLKHNSFVSLIKSKFPPEILLQLEEFELHKPSDPGTDMCQQIRDRLNQIITIKEQMNKGSDGNEPKGSYSKKEESKFKPSTTSTLTIQPKCHFCSSQHWSDNCTQYATVNARKERVKGSCFLCLSKSHQAKDCLSNKICYYCKQKRKHHRSLCFKNTKKGEEVVTVVSSKNNSNKSIESVQENILKSKVSMQTATATLANVENNFTTNTRVLLDTGSQRSYITEQTAKTLQLTYLREEYLSVCLFNSSKPKNIKSYVVKFFIKLIDGSQYLIYANVVPNIVENTIFNEIDIIKHKYQYLKFAENPELVNNDPKIGLLLGNDYYFDFFNLEKLEITNGLFLINSKLGWILSGRNSESNNSDVQCLCLYALDKIKGPENMTFKKEPYVLNQNLDLQHFWNLETLGINENIEETGDDLAMKQFSDSVRFENGRYSISWPWRYYPTDDLADNYNLAYGRLKSLYKRLSSDKELLIKYNNIIKQQLELGMIEVIEPKVQSSSIVHYLPHHAVITPQKTTTKVRIVFDGSASSRKDKLSLNQCLLRGRILMEDLVGILLRARFGEVLITADIEKAFLQISLNEDSKDVTRFIWIKDLSKGIIPDNIIIFRFRRVLFGIISSPFILNAVIKYHLNKYDNNFAKLISDNIYVDNVVVSMQKSDIEQFYKTGKNIFQTASMNLREWNTNYKDILSKLPTEDVDSKETISVLGLVWDTINDKFKVKIKDLDNSYYTKRSILKSVSSIFDPIGIVSPIVISAKIFLQTLWKKGKDWDSEIDKSDQVIWLDIKQNLMEIANIGIPRIVLSNKETTAQLHCFCDASQNAYAAVIYIRQLDTGKSTLLYSKIRLAPTKTVTIPRLELLSVMIGTRILKFIKKEIGFYQSFIWTDSQCVIKWLESKKPLALFIEKRILEIKSIKNCEIRFVSGEMNICADVASRGCTYSKLVEMEEWWSGPNWLKNQIAWPKPELGWINDDLGSVEDVVVLSNSDSKTNSPFDIDIKKFSNLSKLLKITGWCYRAVKNFKGSKCKDELDSLEIEMSRVIWIKYVQTNKYRQVFEDIRLKKFNHLVRQLGLYIDEGIIRCKGRFENADLELGEKCPILLPPKDEFTDLVIRDLHKRLYHVGTAHTLAQLRSTYWVPQGRSVVNRIIKQCILCRKIDGKALPYPDPPPLPQFRVTKSACFETVGIDYLGPLYTKYKGQCNSCKVWVCLFTCLVTRAIHLEVVDDLTGEAFLLSFRRFISRRRIPSLCISDNAWQFQNTSIVINRAWDHVLNNKEVKGEVATLGIVWKFIPEFSPWMGGVYERLISLVKKCLKKSFRNLCLSHDQLSTVICEIEAILNSRPLVYVGEEEGEAITPAHFTSLRTTSVAFAPSDGLKFKSTASENILTLWKKGNKLLDQFWNSWRGEYLFSLREKHNLFKKTPNSSFKPFSGQLVHLKEEKVPRQKWKLGKIIKLNPSQDGVVRSAEVKTETSTVTRPINHLFPLEGQN